MSKTVVFMATNGVGLGHLTRLLAIAKRYKRLEPDAQIIFFSTSLAVEVVLKEGFIYYYFPSKSSLPEKVTGMMWNDMLYGYLGSILEIYQPHLFVFDGAFPYDSMTSLFRLHPNMITVWVKRCGRYKENVTSRERHFKSIIIPRDITDEIKEDENKHYFEPIMLVDKNQTLKREEIRALWGIESHKKVIYIQLGTGKLNDIESIMQRVLSVVLTYTDYEVVIGESIIGTPLSIVKDRVHIVRTYPNAMYFNGIDLAITASGYNTFHELAYFNIPAIWLPNLMTVCDNQILRAKTGERLGLGICIEDSTEERIKQALLEIEKKVNDIALNKEAFCFENGALDLARYLHKIMKEWRG